MSSEELVAQWRATPPRDREIRLAESLDTQIAALNGLEIPEVTTPAQAKELRENVRRKMVTLQGQVPGPLQRYTVAEQASRADTPDEAVKQTTLFLIQSGILVRRQK